MNKEFIPYEESSALKELGFNEPCFGYWNIDPYLPKPTLNLVKPFDHEWCIPAPLYQQAFRWFRDKHKIHAVVEITIESQWYFSIYNLAAKRNAEIEDIIDYKEGFITYEESELACLKKLIEIVKNK